jgi:hypothetical protein
MSAPAIGIWLGAAVAAWLALYLAVSLRRGRAARLRELHVLGSLIAALLVGALPALFYDLSAAEPVELPSGMHDPSPIQLAPQSE